MSGASTYPEPATGIALTKKIAVSKAELFDPKHRGAQAGRPDDGQPAGEGPRRPRC